MLQTTIKDEGIEYYNIGCKFNSELSKLFDITLPINITTPLGMIYSFNNLLFYLEYKVAPKQLSNPNINSIMKYTLKKRKYNTVKNYSSILLMSIFSYIDQHENVKEVLKEVNLNLPFMSYKSFSYCNFSGTVYRHDKSLKRFGSLLRSVIELIQEDKYNEETKLNLIKSNSTTENLLDGLKDFISLKD